MRTDSAATTRARRAVALGALVGLWIAGLAGCPGTLDDKQRFLTGTGGDDCGDVEADIFVKKCGGGPCHGPNEPQEKLDLESPNVAERVVGKVANSCFGILADPENPEASVLYEKLLDAPLCGDRMPFGVDPLSASEITCVRDWIAAQEPVFPDAGGGGDDDGGDGG